MLQNSESQEATIKMERPAGGIVLEPENVVMTAIGAIAGVSLVAFATTFADFKNAPAMTARLCYISFIAVLTT